MSFVVKYRMCRGQSLRAVLRRARGRTPHSNEANYCYLLASICGTYNKNIAFTLSLFCFYASYFKLYFAVKLLRLKSHVFISVVQC